MTATASKLLDSKAIQQEYGIKRGVAEKIMDRLPIVRLPEIRKRYVRRDDLEHYLNEHTEAA